jgi:hypothetical protein
MGIEQGEIIRGHVSDPDVDVHAFRRKLFP